MRFARKYVIRSGMHDERLFSLHDAGLGGLGLFLPLLILLVLIGRAYYSSELKPHTPKALTAGLLSMLVIGGLMVLALQLGVLVPGEGQSLPNVWETLLLASVLSFCFSLLSIGFFIVQRQRDPKPAPLRVKLQKFSALFGLVCLALGLSRGLWFTGVCFGLTGVLLLTDMLAKTELVLDLRFFRQTGVFILASFVLWMLFLPPGYTIAQPLRIEFPTIQDWPIGLLFAVLFAVGFPIQVFLALNKTDAQAFPDAEAVEKDER